MSNRDRLSSSTSVGRFPIMYDAGFRVVLEKHLTRLMASDEVTIIPVEVELAERWRGDFYGLLTACDSKIDRSYYWIVMRCNGLLSSWDYDGTKTQIVVPPFNMIERYIQRHQTTRSGRT